jgi:hypothetical protein
MWRSLLVAACGLVCAHKVVADPAIALHTTEWSGRNVCTTLAPGNVPCSQFDISAQTMHEYLVYVVATMPDSGMYGMSFGIEYNSTEHEGVDMFGFVACCTGLSFPHAGPSGYEFPASGGSVKLTWLCPNPTPGPLNAVAGAFDVYAYSADVMAVIPNLNERGGPEFLIRDCTDKDFEIPTDPRAAVRFSEAGDVLGYNPCTGEGTPPPPPGQNPPPPPPLPIPDQEAALYFHITSGLRRPVCDVLPTTITGVITSVPAPEDSALYVVYLLGSPRVASGYMQQFTGARFGIEYDRPQMDILSWTSCCEFEFPLDGWPGSGTGGSFLYATDCPDSLMVMVGYFSVEVHGPATLRIVEFPEPWDHTISIRTCPNHVYTDLPQSRAGWVSIGGAAIGTDTNGCNPMVEPCAPGTVPIHPTTWGNMKSRYRRN